MKKLLLTLLIVILAVGVGVAGWKYWQSKNTPTPGQQTQTDPTQGGKYLVIKEWGVKFEVPTSLKNKLIYSEPMSTSDSEGTTFQTTKLSILLKDGEQTECDPVESASGKAVSSNIMILRVPLNASFDVNRYKGATRADVYSDAQYTYHVNYLTPSCANPALTEQINQLENKVTSLGNI